MARKQNGNLSLVKSDEAKQAQWKEEQQRRQREENSWMLTRAEIKARVGEIRRTLEGFNEMITALHFDITYEDPLSLVRAMVAGNQARSRSVSIRRSPAEPNVLKIA